MSEKEYKYNLIEDDKVFVVKRVYSDASRQNQRVIRNGREGIWKPNLGMRKKDFKFTKTSAAMYGEFIAHLLQKKIGFPTCDVELLKRRMVIPRSASGRTADVVGCISYIDGKPGELINALSILSWYKDVHYEDYKRIMNPLGENSEADYVCSSQNENNNNNIELIIPALEAYAKEQFGASEEQVNEIRQNIINMVVFDCKFANQDRNDENYGLKISESGISLYPTFDNEYILGFPEFVEDLQKFSGARLQEHIDKDLTSRMGITSQVHDIGYQAMLTFLFTTYPEETKKAYESVMQIKESDLSEIMNECEGLDDFHKDYALRIFRSRNRGFKYVKEEYIDENGNLIPQILPGNKPMEFSKKKSSSKSPKEISETTKQDKIRDTH